MKKLAICIFCIFLFAVAAHSQCVVPAGFVCLTQTQVDKIAKDLDELKASRDVIAKYAAQVSFSDVQTAAYKTLVQSMQDAFDARGKIVIDQDHLIDLQRKVIEMYGTLVEKMTAQLNKGKSAWQKFVGIVEKIAAVMVGITIGRAGL